MNLFKMFSKKKSINEIDSNKPYEYWDINRKRYAIKEKISFSVQGKSDNIRPYAWILEVRYISNGRYTNWYSPNYKTYFSENDAIQASIKMYLSKMPGYESKISPIYKMEKNEYRTVLIDQLLIDEKDIVIYPIKFWILLEDYEVEKYKRKYKKGQIFVQMENGKIVIPHINERTMYGQQYYFKHIKNDVLKEVSYNDIESIHPHLLKEIKNKFK